MAKKKIDLSGAKEFLFHHGEKVALGTCVFIAVVLGAWGMWRALTAGKAASGKPWAEELQALQQTLDRGVQGATAEKISDGDAVKIDKPDTPWEPVRSKFEPSPYISISPVDLTKRSNPSVLALSGSDIQVDYIRGLVFVHDTAGFNLRIYKDGGGAAPGGPGVAGFGAGAGGGPMPPGMGNVPANKAAGSLDVVKAAQHRRMVVVHARFPMIKQMEEFQRALRMPTQKDMLIDNKDDLPKVLGIDVVKFEIKAGKKLNPNGVLLFGVDPKTGKLEKAKALDDLLKVAIFDEDSARLMEPFIHEGLCIPMPKLANAQYPRFKFEGIDIAWVDEPAADPNKFDAAAKQDAKPKDGGPAVPVPGFKGKDKIDPAAAGMLSLLPDRKIENKKAKDLLEKDDPPLHKRLFGTGDYNLYHVLGHYKKPAAAAAPAKQGFIPNNATNNNAAVERYFSMFDVKPGVAGAGGGIGANPMGPPPERKNDPMGPGAADANFPDWDRDAVVRFIDVDVQPGSSYQYMIRVRMANPNHKKPQLVAFGNLAEAAELVPSQWVQTKEVFIPYEYFLYAMDQHQIDEWAEQKNLLAKKVGPASKLDPYQLKKDETTFQLHQWTGTAPAKRGDDLVIGDWTVAERVVVRRGDRIGEKGMVVAPTWKKDKDAFEVPLHDIFEKGVGFKAKDVKVTKAGFEMNFKDTEAERPVLIDFVGGKRAKLPGPAPEEETVVETLIMAPDGRLMVLNSRTAADANQEYAPDGITLVTRQECVMRARDRAAPVIRRQTVGGAVEGPPGMKDQPKVPGGK